MLRRCVKMLRRCVKMLRRCVKMLVAYTKKEPPEILPKIQLTCNKKPPHQSATVCVVSSPFCRFWRITNGYRAISNPILPSVLNSSCV